MPDPRVVRLHPARLTIESFAPFGVFAAQPPRDPDWVASGLRVSAVRETPLATDARVAELWRLGDLVFETDTPYVGFVRYFNQGFQLAELERHWHENQTWLSVAGNSFLVVAPETPTGGALQPENARAFVVEPGNLVSIRAGVWMCHFFPLLDKAEFLVVTARRLPEQDREVVNLLETSGSLLEIALE